MKNELPDEITQIKELLNKGDISAAKNRLLSLSETEPDRKDVWVFLASIATRSEDIHGGIEPFRNLIRLDPFSSIASSGLARAYYKTGAREEALREIRRFKEIANPEELAVQRVLAEHHEIEEMLQNS